MTVWYVARPAFQDERDVDLPFSWGGDPYKVKVGINPFPPHIAQHATGKFPAYELTCHESYWQAEDALSAREAD